MRILSSRASIVFLCFIYYYLSYFFQDENRNSYLTVSLSGNQTIYCIKTNAISYSMCTGYINVDLLTCEEHEEHVMFIMF